MMIGLSKHIEILLLSNDCVIVPGFGGFMAYHVDARKDPADGSFLPPLRSIGFNPKLTLNDSLLAQSYVEAYDISYPDATMRIEDEVRELRQRIEKDGSYEFKGIGRIRLNDEGNYEFVPCEAGLLSPTLYGLGSFQMLTVAQLRAIAALSAHDEKAKTHAVQQSNDDGGTRKRESRHSARITALWRNLAVASIAVILFLIIPAPIVNNAQMAGTGIDTSLLDKVMPKSVTTGSETVGKAVKSSGKLTVADKPQASAKETIVENTETKKPDTGYAIVVASRVTLSNANAYAKDLQRRGFTDAFVSDKGHVKVLIGHFDSRQKAVEALNKLNDKDEFAGAWITDIK